MSSPIGWWRAAASALTILAVGAGLLVYLPNWVLTHLSGVSRDGRVALATVEFLLALGAMAWALRRLQQRRVV
jgi:hypothetical protein